MHAVAIPVTFNDRAAAEAELPELVSQVSATPGFVAGYWIAWSPEKGTSVVMFDSEEQAEAAAARAGEAPAVAVTIGAVEVGEVLAHA